MPEAQKPPVANQPPTQPHAQGGINLLPDVAEKEIKAGVYKRKVNVLALGALGAVGILIVGILLFQGALALEANNVKQQTIEAEDKILENQEVEIKARATKEKLDKIEELLKSAIPSSTFVDEIGKASATSEPISVTNLSLSDSGEAFVDGTAVSSEIFKQWVTNLTSTEAKKYFDKINAVALTGNPTEGYKFSFKLSFLTKGVYELDAK